MAKLAYVPNPESVKAFNVALDASVNAIRDMALALLGELVAATSLSEAKAMQSAYVREVREDRKSRMTARVRKELFDRSEREVKALYKEGKLSQEAREAWSRYNMISKRAGQIAKIRDAMFERPEIRDAVEQFLTSKGKTPTFSDLENMVRGNRSGAGNKDNKDNKEAFTLEKFETALRNMLAGARKAGFEDEALQVMAKLARRHSGVRK